MSKKNESTKKEYKYIYLLLDTAESDEVEYGPGEWTSTEIVKNLFVVKNGEVWVGMFNLDKIVYVDLSETSSI